MFLMFIIYLFVNFNDIRIWFYDEMFFRISLSIQKISYMIIFIRVYISGIDFNNISFYKNIFWNNCGVFGVCEFWGVVIRIKDINSYSQIRRFLRGFVIIDLNN